MRAVKIITYSSPFNIPTEAWEEIKKLDQESEMLNTISKKELDRLIKAYHAGQPLVATNSVWITLVDMAEVLDVDRKTVQRFVKSYSTLPLYRGENKAFIIHRDDLPMFLDEWEKKYLPTKIR